MKDDHGQAWDHADFAVTRWKPGDSVWTTPPIVQPLEPAMCQRELPARLGHVSCKRSGRVKMLAGPTSLAEHV